MPLFLRALWSNIQPWLKPLARTFLSVFLLTFLGSLAKVDVLSSISTLGSLALAAVGTALNAVVLVAQRLAPGVPNPQPPAG